MLLINLDRRPDRLEAVTRLLSDASIEFERVSAVDGSIAAEGELLCSKDRGPMGELSLATRSCTASHVKALGQFLLTEANFALILEDDVAVRPELAALLKDDAWLAGRTDILKIEKFGPKRPSKILAGAELGNLPDGLGTFRTMLSRHTGAAAYIISRRGAEYVIGLSGRIDVPIDHLLFNESVSPLFKLTTPSIALPPLAWQSEEVGMGSNIPVRRVVHGTPNRQVRITRSLRSLRRAWNELRVMPKQLFYLMTGKASIVTLTTPVSRGTATPRIYRALVRKLSKRRKSAKGRARV